MCEQILPEDHKEQKVNGNFQKPITQQHFRPEEKVRSLAAFKTLLGEKKKRLSTSSGKKPKVYLGCVTLLLLKFLVTSALEK